MGRSRRNKKNDQSKEGIHGPDKNVGDNAFGPKKLAILNIIITAIAVSFLLSAKMTHEAISLTIGCLTIFLNFLFLDFAWKLIFQKKLIALTVLLIVSKYPILGLVIYIANRNSWLDPVWFAVGGLVFVIATVVLAIKERKDVI